MFLPTALHNNNIKKKQIYLSQSVCEAGGLKIGHTHDFSD